MIVTIVKNGELFQVERKCSFEVETNKYSQSKLIICPECGASHKHRSINRYPLLCERCAKSITRRQQQQIKKQKANQELQRIKTGKQVKAYYPPKAKFFSDMPQRKGEVV